MSRESGALVVCAEMRKLLREPEEEALDDEREMFAFRALWGGCVSTRRTAGCVGADPLFVLRDIIIGWLDRALLWTCVDTSMALLVVDNAKRRVALNAPDILP